MQTISSIKDTAREFINEKFLFGIDDFLDDSASLLENGIIDSTGVMEVISFIENTYNIRVEQDELIPDNLDSIDAIANFIIRKISEE